MFLYIYICVACWLKCFDFFHIYGCYNPLAQKCFCVAHWLKKPNNFFVAHWLKKFQLFFFVARWLKMYYIFCSSTLARKMLIFLLQPVGSKSPIFLSRRKTCKKTQVTQERDLQRFRYMLKKIKRLKYMIKTLYLCYCENVCSFVMFANVSVLWKGK